MHPSPVPTSFGFNLALSSNLLCHLFPLCMKSHLNSKCKVLTSWNALWDVGNRIFRLLSNFLWAVYWLGRGVGRDLYSVGSDWPMFLMIFLLARSTLTNSGLGGFPLNWVPLGWPWLYGQQILSPPVDSLVGLGHESPLPWFFPPTS